MSVLTARSLQTARIGLAEARKSFDLDRELAFWFPDRMQGVSAWEALCGRFAADPRRLALRYTAKGAGISTLTFAELAAQSTRLANALAEWGIGAGDRVAALLPRTPELLISLLAIWHLGAVYQPMFTAFGPKAVEYRVAEAKTKLIITDDKHRAQLGTAGESCKLLCVQASRDGSETDFWSTIERQSSERPLSRRSLTDPFLIMFTSGTTGPAKSLEVPIKAIAAFGAYDRDAVDIRPEDCFLGLADPGWAYGLYYGVIGPLALGCAITFYNSPFAAQDTFDLIERVGITNMIGSPTAYRLLVAAGPQGAKRIRGQLRAVSSAGEVLNPEVIRWFAQNLDVTVHDHFGQTEVGMIVCNHHALDHTIRLGSAGFAPPGYRVVLLDQDHRELGPQQPGQLALDRANSPLAWFGGYLNKTTTAFVGDYYITGDVAEQNNDGSISFVGRSDDVITSAGYRIGPFDVESALLEHPAVAESAVIGKPDPERTEIVKAFVVLKPGFEGGAELEEALRQQVRKRLSAHAYPREFAFVDSLPKTPSGKIQRFILRNAEKASARP